MTVRAVRAVRVIGLLLAAVLTAAACSESSTALGPPTVEPHGGVGGLVEAEEIDASDIDGRVWAVTYRSESIADDEIEVSGLVARPDAPPPPGGFPILSWAHGTSGLADACAPSALGADGIAMLEPFLDEGYVVAATDYEGLGTAGVHPYLVSLSEGRSVLDVARAVRQVMPDVSDRLVVAGHSQGGHAALAASAIAAEWAPELDLVATVSSAPVSDLSRVVPAMFSVQVAQGFAVLVAAGWAGTYPELEAADVLASGGLEVAEAATDDACVGDVFAAVAAVDDVVAAEPGDLPPWQAKVDENSIDPAGVEGPLLMIQGSEDPVILPSLTDRFADELCAAGASVVYRRYEGADHGTVLPAAFGDMVEWLDDRLAGVPIETTCG